MVSKRVAARKKLPQHLAILFDTPAKRKRADRIMKEGRLIAELQGKRPKKRKKKVNPKTIYSKIQLRQPLDL